MNVLVLLVLVALISGVSAIAFVIKPDDAPPVIYWGSVAWINVLVSLNWFASAIIFSGSKEEHGNRLFGALPGANVVIGIYSLGSIALLAMFMTDVLAMKWHLGTQISAFVTMTVVCLLMGVAAKGAGYSDVGLVSKNALLDEIERIKRVTRVKDDGVRDALEAIRAYIVNEMPHPTKLKVENCAEALRLLQNTSQSGDGNTTKEQLSAVETALRNA